MQQNQKFEMLGMINIKADIEIKNSEQDKLKLSTDVIRFINRYIFSDYEGSVLLNGKWGIGKTSFLNLIEEDVELRKEKKNKREFIWLNAWKENNSENFYSDIFSKLHPWKYFYLRHKPLVWAIILSIIIALIQFIPFFLKGKENLITVNILLIWLALFIINSALSYFKDTYDIEDKCRNKVKKFIKKRKLIFIIDDFDRVDKLQRNILFQKMSDINSFENALIIVVGEYKRIVENPNDIFTQKILQNIENMPEKYKPHNIWNIFESDLETIVKYQDITDADRLIINRIRGQFIRENRTIRESKQLFNRFKNTYKYKQNRNFNASESLALCYIFIFHNQIYEIITNKSIKLTYNTVSIEDEKKQRLRSELLEANINDDSNIIDFIFNLFNHGNDSGMKYPSITKEKNFSLYKIESNESTQVNEDMLEEYLQKDKDEGLKQINSFNEEDYIRFFEMFKRKAIEEQILKSVEAYVKEMIKLVHYKFYGEHSNSGISSFTSPYVDELLYSLSERLEMTLEIDKNKQCEKIALNNRELDASQKILIIELIIPDIEYIDIENKVEMIDGILKELSFSNIQDTEHPRIIYWAYVKYYDHLQNKEIEKVLSELVCLGDSEFVEFIETNFIRIKNIFYKSNGRNAIREDLPLKEFSFNQEFENNFIDKINQLEPQKREKISASIRNATKF
ncbi:P-loop NTPase fold protein [Staphylococcus shinii]|uniref:P-loop NTPase fold protein n=4 Tax=Staphylococcus TaxID=1279 RepID=UPI002DB7FFF6|nr:P-loop NTPase fold protein [Staphylococcus xylosus]MEB8071650.1 KAP family NTPase [Staphylococcus xylosus]